MNKFDGSIIKNDVYDFMGKYHNRLLEITCANDKVFKGEVFRGRVSWFDESDELGISFKDVEFENGEIAKGWDVPISKIIYFIPLEGENSEEYIKKHF